MENNTTFIRNKTRQVPKIWTRENAGKPNITTIKETTYALKTADFPNRIIESA
jgi:hypothetical protein